jgi:hypothetical protein
MATKAVYTVEQFLSEYGLGKTRFYQLVKSGELHVRKQGRRTVVLGIDADRWINSLPVGLASRAGNDPLVPFAEPRSG